MSIMSYTEILPLLIIPLLGTVIGAATVLFVGKGSAQRLHRILLGFASGVMVAASVWSLLIPAMEESADMGNLAWVPAVVGFMLGVFAMLALDTFTPHLHPDSTTPEGPKSKLGNSSMLVLAVTLHNIPEGMAVGVVAAGALTGDVGLSLGGGLALAIGLAIQNIPEGAIISLPLRSSGLSRGRAFGYGALSGVVEPVSALLTILCVEQITGALPYMLAFAAGAMIYVVVEELIPQSQDGEHSNIPTIAFAIGFALMMILDVALG
jgi:ZIP family zinc transporter